MKIITSRKQEFNGVYIDGPTRFGGTLMMRIQDSRTLLDVGADFANLEWIRRESKTQGDKEWTGYTRLVGLREIERGTIMLELAKPETEE